MSCVFVKIFAPGFWGFNFSMAARRFGTWPAKWREGGQKQRWPRAPRLACSSPRPQPPKSNENHRKPLKAANWQCPSHVPRSIDRKQICICPVSCIFYMDEHIYSKKYAHVYIYVVCIKNTLGKVRRVRSVANISHRSSLFGQVNHWPRIPFAIRKGRKRFANYIIFFRWFCRFVFSS